MDNVINLSNFIGWTISVLPRGLVLLFCQLERVVVGSPCNAQYLPLFKQVDDRKYFWLEKHLFQNCLFTAYNRVDTANPHIYAAWKRMVTVLTPIYQCTWLYFNDIM